MNCESNTLIPRIPNVSNPLPKGLVLHTGPTGSGKNPVYALMRTLPPEEAKHVYEVYESILRGEDV